MSHTVTFSASTHLIDCRTVSLCSAALTRIFSSLISLFSRSILALKNGGEINGLVRRKKWLEKETEEGETDLTRRDEGEKLVKK